MTNRDSRRSNMRPTQATGPGLGRFIRDSTRSTAEENNQRNNTSRPEQRYQAHVEDEIDGEPNEGIRRSSTTSRAQSSPSHTNPTRRSYADVTRVSASNGAQNSHANGTRAPQWNGAQGARNNVPQTSSTHRSPEAPPMTVTNARRNTLIDSAENHRVPRAPSNQPSPTQRHPVAQNPSPRNHHQSRNPGRSAYPVAILESQIRPGMDLRNVVVIRDGRAPPEDVRIQGSRGGTTHSVSEPLIQASAQASTAQLPNTPRNSVKLASPTVSSALGQIMTSQNPINRGEVARPTSPTLERLQQSPVSRRGEHRPTSPTLDRVQALRREEIHSQTNAASTTRTSTPSQKTAPIRPLRLTEDQISAQLLAERTMLREQILPSLVSTTGHREAPQHPPSLTELTDTPHDSRTPSRPTTALRTSAETHFPNDVPTGARADVVPAPFNPAAPIFTRDFTSSPSNIALLETLYPVSLPTPPTAGSSSQVGSEFVMVEHEDAEPKTHVDVDVYEVEEDEGDDGFEVFEGEFEIITASSVLESEHNGTVRNWFRLWRH
ncbi:hypothetical protein K505DRAFT_342628 [Melanomma pulvis-pyrius CBS 109.77]|uniref:Uncharacterized protein n=1 Tax=Melanomma pulvis-pyrius CBS 109.77 TaxID=1314802 RepID=A0A6A6WUH5_9PLEO|nr:hypothetical protein K505DRAFT_342628 [Melanomma pulvis-pyrius CBS 109.77]